MVKELSSKQRGLLLYCIRQHEPAIESQYNKLDSGFVDSATINKMREAILQEFTSKGLNPDYEPNGYGIELESLIDAVADVYLWPK